MVSFFSRIFKKKPKASSKKQSHPFEEFVAIDIETTGFIPGKNKIIEIGAVKVENGKIIDSFSTLVNPGTPIKKKITKITGITNDMVENALPIKKVLKDFVKFIDDYPIVVYNAPFDMGFINYYLDKPLDNQIFDLLVECKNIYTFLDNHKLGNVANSLEIEVQGSLHRALPDSELAARIYMRCCDEEKIQCVSCSRKYPESYNKIQCIRCKNPLFGDETPGFIDGEHYKMHSKTFKQFKKENKLDEAESLLLKIVDAVEAESNFTGNGVLPGYYEELSIIYRKQKLYDKEANILKRFANQKHAPGKKSEVLIKRFEKAKTLADKNDCYDM